MGRSVSLVGLGLAGSGAMVEVFHAPIKHCHSAERKEQDQKISDHDLKNKSPARQSNFDGSPLTDFFLETLHELLQSIIRQIPQKSSSG
jgi:hypothetical protein